MSCGIELALGSAVAVAIKIAIVNGRLQSTTPPAGPAPTGKARRMAPYSTRRLKGGRGLPVSKSSQRGTFFVYDESGETLLFESEEVIVESGDVWRLS